MYYPGKLGHRRVFPRINVDAIVLPDQSFKSETVSDIPGELLPIMDIPIIEINEQDGVNIADMVNSLPSINNDEQIVTQDNEINNQSYVLADQVIVHFQM